MSSRAAGPQTLQQLLADAAATLASAGVPSPQSDAVALAAQLAGVSLGSMRAAAIRGDEVPAWRTEYLAWVARRAQREPLQWITGTVQFAGVELAIRPGVFVPRPETEVVAAAGVECGRVVSGSDDGRGLVAVDLCTGSGAIAAVLARELPGAQVIAVDSDTNAVELARQNLATTGAQVVRADATACLSQLSGGVGLVVSNPPYVPLGEELPPEVQRDPAAALFGGGQDGTEIPRAIVARAAALLAPGGYVVMEHASGQETVLRTAATATGLFTEVHTRADLTGRPRMLVARRAQPGPGLSGGALVEGS